MNTGNEKEGMEAYRFPFCRKGVICKNWFAMVPVRCEVSGVASCACFYLMYLFRVDMEKLHSECINGNRLAD